MYVLYLLLFHPALLFSFSLNQISLRVSMCFFPSVLQAYRYACSRASGGGGQVRDSRREEEEGRHVKESRVHTYIHVHILYLHAVERCRAQTANNIRETNAERTLSNRIRGSGPMYDTTCRCLSLRITAV